MEDAGKKARGFGDVVKGVLAADAIKAGARAIVNFTKQTVQAYADYEQLVGGVQTLFGLGGQSLDEYAKSQGKSIEDVKDEWLDLTTAERVVLNNADAAFKTAGLSANEYMETVTSFSASLLQSLGGDTKKAAEYADLAVVDMSDNANKMGTSMESIQAAYTGFSKQNYTMLDNLKLGYGGTKTEMERLIKDAEGLDSTFKASRDSNGDLTMSYADIVDAIHIVQDEMGITGTTAKEASSTISGSIASMKAAFTNFMTGLADENADIEQLTEDLVGTIGTVLSNLGPVVGRVLKTIGSLALDGIKNIGRNIWQSITDTFNNIVDSALNWGRDLIDNFLNGIKQKWENLKNGVKGVAQVVKNFLGFSEPEEGPLSNFHTYAPDMMELFAKGIRDNEGLVTDQIAKSFDFGSQIYTATADGKKSVATARSNTDALLEQILVKLSGMGIYLDGNTLLGWMDDGLGQRAVSGARLSMG